VTTPLSARCAGSEITRRRRDSAADAIFHIAPSGQMEVCETVWSNYIDIINSYFNYLLIEHKRLATEYHALPDDKLKASFFKEHSAKWFELSRLSYFDPVRMTVIDPMHNILLGMSLSLNQAYVLISCVGIVKNQWYNSWINTNTLRERTSTLKTPRELDQIHGYLQMVRNPWAFTR
jgi:hypothetical protein